MAQTYSQPALLALRRQRMVEEGRDDMGRLAASPLDALSRAPRTVLADPNWQAWFESVNQAADGRDVRFAGGPSAPGSTQLRGRKASLLGMSSIADDPNSTFNDNPYFPRAPKGRR